MDIDEKRINPIMCKAIRYSEGKCYICGRTGIELAALEKEFISLFEARIRTLHSRLTNSSNHLISKNS